MTQWYHCKSDQEDIHLHAEVIVGHVHKLTMYKLLLMSATQQTR